MKYIVAVSGGVDSVVLLDMLVMGQLAHDGLVVAHFDHGMRDDSAEDAAFVRDLAAKYNVLFEAKRGELGANASEELARERRYAFLRDVAKKYEATIMTAHHADDVIETIAINVTRGTGWRGLAVMDSPGVERPLIGMKKSELREYANQHNLTWREDATNQDTKYLRNNLRQRLHQRDEQMHELLLRYRDRQVVLRKAIDAEAAKLFGTSPYSRYLFIQAPVPAAEELLRAVIVHTVGYYSTRPQLQRALHAIKVLQTGKRHHIANGVRLVFTVDSFVVEKG